MALKSPARIRPSPLGSASIAARHSGSAAWLTGGRGCTDLIVIGGAPSRSITPSIGVSVGVIGTRDSSPPPPAPRSGSRIRTREVVGLEAPHLPRPQFLHAQHVDVVLARDAQHRARVGLAEPQVAGHHHQPRSARLRLRPGDRPRHHREAERDRGHRRDHGDRAPLSTSAATTGSGEVSAAYGVNAISATSG